MAASDNDYRVQMSTAIVAKQPHNEQRADVDEKFVAEASWWTLDDLSVILPPPGFCGVSYECAMDSMAGPELIPCLWKGRARFGWTNY